MFCALDTMTNKAFTLNTFPDTEVDIAPIEGPHAIDADQQGATSSALPALNDQQGSFAGSGALHITEGGQDRAAQFHRQRHRPELSRRLPAGRLDWRAAGGGH